MPLDLWGDFGFAAGANRTANPYQDSQECINYYPELSPSRESKVAVSLLGRPGLIQLAADPNGGAPGNQSSKWPAASSVTNLPVRGFWVLPGYTTALAVIGATCYLVKQLTQGTTTTPGVISLTNVGTLSTFSGPVKMRDNNTSAGSSASVLIVDGQFGYTYGILTGTFAQINAAGFTAFNNPSTVAYIDGWWIVGCTGSQQFFTNSPIYSNTWNSTFFSLKDGASDNLVAVMENKEELWLLGERTSEIWYNAGATNFAFQRVGGTLQQIGCKAPYSVSRFKVGGEDSLIWYGRSERGENVIVRTQGFNASVVSTNAVSDAIATYNTTGDAVGYCYEEDGHSFYVLTFPSADKTWVYDASLPPELAWHQRLSYDPYTSSFHRERPNAFMNFAGMRIVGDYQNGAIYQMTRAAYTDGGWPILSRRRSPFIWDAQNRRRVHMTDLQVEFAPGVGNSIVTYPQPNQNTTGYNANALSATNAYLKRGAALTGISNSKQGSISFWMNAKGFGTGAYIIEILNALGGAGFSVLLGSNGGLGINASNASNASIMTIGPSTLLSTGTLYHVLASWDLGNNLKNCYINNVSSLSAPTFTNDTISYNGNDTVIFNDEAVNSQFNGTLSELWFNNTYIDFSNPTNRAAFISSGGYPVFLGLNGQLPTGSSPLIYLNGTSANPGINNGIGGNFTATGNFLNGVSPSIPPAGTLTAGIGSNPQARLRISRDYGTTYGEPILSPMGKIGNYTNRCIYRKLGWTRGSVAEIEVIDPVNRDITGVTLRAFGE